MNQKPNLDFYLEQIRQEPRIYEYWRDCPGCGSWFGTRFEVEPKEDIRFCSSVCLDEYSELGNEPETKVGEDGRISWALSLIEDIPTSVISLRFFELKEELNRYLAPELGVLK